MPPQLVHINKHNIIILYFSILLHVICKYNIIILDFISNTEASTDVEKCHHPDNGKSGI